MVSFLLDKMFKRAAKQQGGTPAVELPVPKPKVESTLTVYFKGGAYIGIKTVYDDEYKNPKEIYKEFVDWFTTDVTDTFILEYGTGRHVITRSEIRNVSIDVINNGEEKDEDE